MKAKLILIATFAAFNLGFTQISGRCVDEKGVGISYANITVKGKTLGTVSDRDGYFRLNSETLDENDSLIVSHINFNEKTIRLVNIPDTIKMSTRVHELDEIVVTDKRMKNIREIIVGTKTKSANVVLKFVSNNLGTEVGKIIKVKKNRVFDLKKMFFNIVELGYHSATFRVNFYPINNGTFETTKVNIGENIITTYTPGIVEIDLSDQNLSFYKDFLASIEWIDFENDHGKLIKDQLIYISSTVFSGPFANRENINLPWKMEKLKYNCGIGIHLLADSYVE